ncbi:CsbD family protein [Methylobacterium brachiatum]|nr:CsbD family protein [Methylobacterium brachiatum]
MKRPSAERVKASVKEAIGKLTGDARVEAEGRRQKQAARPPKPAKPRTD